MGDVGEEMSIDTVYERMTNFNGDSHKHHDILRFLEEGAIDMVCLVTDIDFERCDEVRGKNNLESGQYSNCWINAYKAIYGDSALPVDESKFVNSGADSEEKDE